MSEAQLLTDDQKRLVMCKACWRSRPGNCECEGDQPTLIIMRAADGETDYGMKLSDFIRDRRRRSLFEDEQEDVAPEYIRGVAVPSPANERLLEGAYYIPNENDEDQPVAEILEPVAVPPEVYRYTQDQEYIYTSNSLLGVHPSPISEAEVRDDNVGHQPNELWDSLYRVNPSRD